MEEKNEQSNLPVEVKDKGILANPKVFKTLDAFKRAGKIAGAIAIGTVGLGVTAVSSGPLMVVGAGMFLGGVARMAQNSYLKVQSNMLFGSRKLSDKSIGVYQDPLNVSAMTRMLGYGDLDKMAMMGMQALVGLDRFKVELQDSQKYEIDENGRKVYDQKFSTVTHSSNLEVLKALDAMGYIKLDSMEANFKGRTIDERLARRNEKGEIRSYLIGERLGFGNYSAAGKAIKAMFSKDQGEKDKNTRVMKLATFRLTDKPLDLEEISNAKTNPEYKKLPDDVYKSVRLLSMMPRVIAKRKVEIVEDRSGRRTMKYPSRMENVKLVRNNIKGKIKDWKEKHGAKEVKEVSPDLVASKKMAHQKEIFEEELKQGVVQPVVNMPEVKRDVEEPTKDIGQDRE